MNEIKVNVSFEKRTVNLKGVKLTTGDYNSTKIIFEFDKEYEGRKIFELARPQNIDETGQAIFVKEVENNEVVLVAYDENGKEVSIFTEKGDYPFEITLYNDNGKLTSANGKLKVSKEMVKIGDEVVERYIPVFDDLMNKANTIIDNLEAFEKDIQDAEVTRNENEEARIKAEGIRVENENNRKTAEENRSKAEADRATAEETRIQNEETRQENETSRVNSETARNEAETSRSEAEQTRDDNETTRTQNEADRATAEIARKEAEESRVLAENARVEAEKNRATAETKRVEAENLRDDAEKSRNEAETVRENAEKTRDEAETTRKEAEATRNNNETAREESETIRNENESTRNANEIMRQEKFRMIDKVLKDVTVQGSNIHIKDSADWFAKVGVCGKSEQETREGYNLLNFDCNQIITRTPQTNYVTIEVNLNPFTKGAGSYKYTCSGTFGTAYKIWAYDSNGNIIVNIASGEFVELTEEQSNSIVKIILVVTGLTIGNTYSGYIYPMITFGKEEKEYEQYGAMPSFLFPSPVKSVTGDIENKFCNKNLLNPVGKSQTLEGINFINNEDGTFTLKGTNTSTYGINFPLTDLSKYPIYLEKGKTYTQSFILISGTSGNISVVPSIIDDNGNITWNYFKNNQTKTSDKNCKIYAYNLYFPASEIPETLNFTFKVQLEEGTVATDYEPHQSQTVVFPLAEGQRLMKGSYLADNGVHHKRKQIVLDGSNDEMWEINGEKQGYSIVINNIGGNIYSAEVSNVICNKLIAAPQSNIYNGEQNNIIATVGDVHKIYVRIDETITSVPLLRTFLSQNPIEVEYDLIEEIIEPYTEAQQVVYNELKKLKTYQTVTNITSDAHLEVTYKKDLQTQLNEIQALVLESGV